MTDFEKDIEGCYLGVIPINILKGRLNFRDISDYLFAKELLNIAEKSKNSDAVHVAFLIFDEYELQEDDFGLLDIFFQIGMMLMKISFLQLVELEIVS